MVGDKVKYSDLIQDDGALDRLLNKLDETATTFEGLVNTAKSSARDISNALNSMSSATQAGRDSILAANAAVTNLKSVTAQLKVSISDTSQAVTGLKAAISENTTVTAKSYSAIEQAIGKYDKLKTDLQDYMNLYKSLTTQEKSSPFGQQTLEEITKLSSQVNALTADLRALTKTQKERLSIDEQEVNATRKLAHAQSDANEKQHEHNIAIREANRIAKLNAAINRDGIDSYNGMAAQYELNKIKLRKLALANRELTGDEKKLAAETYTLRAEMKKFQEMTGVHTLSVGNYGKVWDSFGFSIQQIVREMPAAAQGINNLFIAVANNIPIFVDELMKLRKENAAFIAQNQPDKVVSIGKRIAASLFSWQTALMALLTALTMFGDDILKWIGSLFKGEAAAMSAKKAIKALNKELDSSANGYGENIVAFKKLRDAYVSLNSELKKTEFLEKYKDEMEDLGLAANSVNEADQLFIDRTKDVVEAYKNRAKAAAAKNLAEAKYEEMFKKERELEQAQNGPVTLGDVLAAGATSFSAKGRDVGAEAENARLARVKRLRTEIVALAKDAESFYKMYDEYTGLANTVLAEEGSDPEGRDLTDRIYQARLQAGKKYNEAQTKLIKDEYDRRQRELEDAAQAEIETLKEQRRKAIEWRDDPENNYKDLTADEQRAVQEIISKSSAAILNIEKKLAEDVAQLELDRQINELKIYQDTLNLRLESVEEGSYAEMALREQLLRVQRDLELKENEKTVKVIKAQNAKAARAANEDFINMLKHREAFESKRYVDSGGNATIGYGFTKYTIGQEITDDMVFTEEEADALLRDRIKNVFEPALNQVLDEYGLALNQAQYNELLDLSYQGGGAVARLIEDAINDEEGLEHIRQVYRDVGSQIGADAAERFGESFERAYLEADTIERMGLLLQAENLYTGGVIGGEGGAWYTGMQARSDSRSERFMAEPAPEEIEGNKQLEADIVLKWNKKIADLTTEWSIRDLEQSQANIELKLQAVQKGSEEELELQKELLDKQLELDLKRNSLLGENLQKDETLIKKSYMRREKLLEGRYALQAFQEGQAASRAQYIADNKAGNKGLKSKQLNDYYLDIFDQEQAIALLEEQIWQAEQGFLDWSPEQIAEAKANLVTLNRELDETKDIWNLIGEKGIGGGILTKLGFDDGQIDAFMNATNIVISQIQAIAQAEVEAAEKAAEAAQERVDAAKSAYDAEIEARNNGYANNVATAKAELEQEKKKQKEKQKMLEAAQRSQARIDSAMQMSSLVTATANLWASYSKLGPLGQALTIAAIAAMWGSFGAAKLKAKNVTSQEYGEGGLEFLEGGSHASGNDIDLGTINSGGRRMRAEGGEAMAIINKKNTRKYKALLPGIVDSLNAGNFEDKYLSSLNTSGISLSVNNASIDISKIEDDVADIRKQNETKYYTADGYLIIQRKNVKRIIKN